MKLKFMILFFVILLQFACKTTTNQMVQKQKEGLWVEYDTLDVVYKTIGKYQQNNQIGTWKYYRNNKLIRKEKYYKDTCKTKFYHPNGKLQKKGYTTFEVKDHLNHWYYFGKWQYYDKNRHYLHSKYYYKGKPSDSAFTDYQENEMRFSTH